MQAPNVISEDRKAQLRRICGLGPDGDDDDVAAKSKRVQRTLAPIVNQTDVNCAKPDGQPETAFDVVIRLEVRIRRMLSKLVGPSRVDDAWSEVVLERITRVVETFKPTNKLDLDKYVLMTMRWYAYKWAFSHRHTGPGSKITMKHQTTSLADGDMMLWDDADVPEVTLLLAQVHPFYAWVLVTRFLEDYTVEEMGKHLGVSRNVARTRIAEAVHAAKMLRAETLLRGFCNDLVRLLKEIE